MTRGWPHLAPSLCGSFEEVGDMLSRVCVCKAAAGLAWQLGMAVEAGRQAQGL